MIDESRALRRKYEAMRALRAAPRDDDPRDALRALAAEFPGALRELDDLPLPEIDRRIAHLVEVEAGGSPEPWVAPLARYHALLREGLEARSRGVRGAGVVDGALAALSAESGLDVPTLRGILFPHAQGRRGR